LTYLCPGSYVPPQGYVDFLGTACPFVERSHCYSSMVTLRVRSLIAPTLEATPSQWVCHYPHPSSQLHLYHQPHPVRAKLAQNFITILLRFFSSSEAPSMGQKEKCLAGHGVACVLAASASLWSFLET
jgi:hypothetical protein